MRPVEHYINYLYFLVWPLKNSRKINNLFIYRFAVRKQPFQYFYCRDWLRCSQGRQNCVHDACNTKLRSSGETCIGFQYSVVGEWVHFNDRRSILG